ncbi:MAG: serine protein kinase RIO [Nitrososphaerota archaeon]
MNDRAKIEERTARDLFRIEKESRYLIKRSEEEEALEAVFDRQTLFTLYSMINRGIIDYLNGVVRAGKEARVYWGVKGDSDLAVKIFYTSTAPFKRRAIYITADPRFKGIKSFGRAMLMAWVRKEFKNLKQAEDGGVRVPHPVYCERNILVMEFIGEKGIPAKTLSELSNITQKDYRAVINSIEKLYNYAKIVHSDLSEYNIFKFKKQIILFDFGSAVDIAHPMAEEFLVRDIKTINRFFKKFDIEVYEPETLLRKVGLL